jgi:hypothetical protein
MADTPLFDGYEGPLKRGDEFGSGEALEKINAKGHDFIHIDGPYAEFSCVDCHTGGSQK